MEFLHEDPSPVEISPPEPSFEPDSPIDFLKHVWFPPVTCSGATQQQHKEEPVNEVCTDKCDPLPMPVHSPSVVVEEAPLECTPSVFMKNRIKHVKRSDIKIDKDVRFLSPSTVIRSKLTATSYEGKSPEVVKAMKDREKQLREKQIRALMEKKEREVKEKDVVVEKMKELMEKTRERMEQVQKEKEEVAHRMKEKEELWLREKSVLETVGVGCGGERQKWKKIQHDNYNRSLDTRSYTFKTQDKKAMGAKVFVDGIRVATAELA